MVNIDYSKYKQNIVKLVDSMRVTNRSTGQGTESDFSKNIMVSPGQAIQPSVQSALYHGSAIARNIVTKLPDTALSKGIKINTSDQDESNKLIMQMDQDDVVNKFRVAAGLARNFGGAAIVLNIDDGQLPEKELNPDKIQGIYGLDVYDCRYLKIEAYETNPESPMYGKPSLIKVLRETMFDQVEVITHTSRMIIFEGLETTIDEQKKRQGWQLCIYDLIKDILDSYNTAFYAVNQMLSSSNLGIYKVQDLHKLLASENSDLIMDRYSLMDKCKSVFRSIVIGEGESFEYKTMNLAGISDLLDKYTMQLSQAVNIPIIVLTGQSPSGLNATGQADLRLWYNYVDQYFESYLKKKFEDISAIYMRALGIQEPEKWSVTIPSVWAHTPEEIMNQKKAVIESDISLIDSGQFTAEEIVIFRSQEDGFDKDLELSEDGKKVRELSLKRIYEKAISSASNPAEPTPEEERT
jgi:phage-related protein (TIGR01555 family)